MCQVARNSKWTLRCLASLSVMSCDNPDLLVQGSVSTISVAHNDIDVFWRPCPTPGRGAQTSIISVHNLLMDVIIMPLLCWSVHATLIQPRRMKQMDVPDVNVLPTLLSSVRIIWLRQGLELLVGTIPLMHTFCRWAWHSNQTCTSLKLTAVVNNLIYLFCYVSFRCQFLMPLYFIKLASNIPRWLVNLFYAEEIWETLNF